MGTWVIHTVYNNPRCLEYTADNCHYNSHSAKHCKPRYYQFDVTHTILHVQSEYEEYSYSVKVINPNDNGGSHVEQLQTKYPKLTTVEKIRPELSN